MVASNGGELVTGHEVTNLAELPRAAVTLLDVTPRQLVAMAGGRLDGWAGRSYRRFRYGPGACKVDYVLSGPMPWTAEAARQAGTLHLGGDLAELVASERAPSRGQIPERPFVLVTQPTVADTTRAPGRHPCPLGLLPRAPGLAVRRLGPHRGPVRPVTRPGWRDLVVAREVRRAVDLAAYNPNYVGGDIVGGAMTPRQIIGRPRLGLRPYDTPLPGVLLCSASTPPGGAVHGMCGWHAAGRALACSAPDTASRRPSQGIRSRRADSALNRERRRDSLGGDGGQEGGELLLGQLAGGAGHDLPVAVEGHEVGVGLSPHASAAA